jgi:RHS repeat-associated protein
MQENDNIFSAHEGSFLQAITYGPFGDTLTSIVVLNNNSLHSTGREHDPDSGLYYYRAKYYDPTIGRFLTEDPKGFKAGVSFYAYCKNNPINANDPTGLTWRSDVLGFTTAGLNP